MNAHNKELAEKQKSSLLVLRQFHVFLLACSLVNQIDSSLLVLDHEIIYKLTYKEFGAGVGN